MKKALIGNSQLQEELHELVMENKRDVDKKP